MSRILAPPLLPGQRAVSSPPGIICKPPGAVTRCRAAGSMHSLPHPDHEADDLLLLWRQGAAVRSRAGAGYSEIRAAEQDVRLDHLDPLPAIPRTQDRRPTVIPGALERGPWPESPT